MRDDLWPIAKWQGSFAVGPLHYHDEPVRIYVLSGTIHVHVSSSTPALRAEAGSRIDIPAGALHAISAEGEVLTITALASAKATAGLPQLLPR
ncbi:MAG TPA: hypothetical protein VKC60_15945 [Opitutaceae bacterium]|nr:hypothetical protein [Opitutaceae bacterium]